MCALIIHLCAFINYASNKYARRLTQNHLQIFIGLAHSTAGYLTYAGFTQKQAFSYFDNNDVFGCVADIGWITGHTYVVYGTLMNGGTTVLFESTPTYPDPGRYWETVQRLKINQFYGAPTAIR